MVVNAKPNTDVAIIGVIMLKSEFMNKVGATMGNTRWSWCGVNEQDQQAFFIVFDVNCQYEKETKSNRCLIRGHNWDDPSNPGHNEQRDVLTRCLNGDLSSNVVIAELDRSVKDNDVIRQVRGKFYLPVELVEDEKGSIYGRSTGKVEL